MKLLLFNCLLLISISANVLPQGPFSLSITNKTFREALKEIEKNSQLHFFYNEKFIDLDKSIDLKVSNVSEQELLEQLFKDQMLTYQLLEGNLVVITPQGLEQELVVKGKVTDSQGNSLPGVNIVEKGTTNGAVTDLDGNYTITVSSPEAVLSFSYIGYLTEEIQVGAQTSIDVLLVEDIMTLDEVVVTALGIEREKKALGYAAQELGSEELSAAREMNISSFLTGKVAGVQINKTSGGTGASSSVTIRGISSLVGSNQPLYVVDGVPIINRPKSEGGLSGDTDYGDGIGDINPEDVESMTVLKGPNASALYGSRGANGVILITTKSGKKRKGIGVELNSNLSFEYLNQIPAYQNYYATGYQETTLRTSGTQTIDDVVYPKLRNIGGDSWGAPLDGKRIVADPFLFPGEAPRTLALLPQPYDNIRNFYEVGMVNTNTVALSGGNEKSTSRLSFGNTYSKGIVPNHKVEKQTASFRNTTQLTDFLSFDTKVNYIYDEGNQRPSLGGGYDNVSRNLVSQARYVPMDFLKEYYEETGTYGQFPGVIYNPYYIVNELKNRDYRNRVIGYFSTTLRFTDWLSLVGRVGVDSYSETREKKWPVGSFLVGAQGRYVRDVRSSKELNADVLLTANKRLSDNFVGTLTVGASLLRQKRENMSVDGEQFKSPGIYDVNNVLVIVNNESLWQKEMQSVFFTGQLAYKDFWFLDVTGRNDWSSALGINNYSFFYPSVGTSLIFTDAFGLNNNSILSFGKVRASWAQVGNDSNPYLTTEGYTLYSTDYEGHPVASRSGNIPLWDLKNELNGSWEVGTDLRFFKNRLSFDITYYDGHTTNQILPILISSASGYSDVIINAGKIRNKGLEAVIGANPFKTNSGFRWDINFNYARNHSEVVELAPGIETYLLASYEGADIEARPGHPYGDIIGYAYKRAPDGQKIVDSETGRYEREDERSILGNISPAWIGGLNNTFSYKGFTVNFLLDFVQGKEIYSQTKYEMTRKGTGAWTTVGRRIQDVDENGDQLPLVGVLPGVVEITDADGNVTGYEPNTRAVYGQDYWAHRAWDGIDEEFVLDGSYIMLREVMFSYSLNESLLERTPFSGITLTLVGRNLFYLEEHMEDLGVSPESYPNTSAAYSGFESFSIPTTRIYGLNVKLTF